jgi:hypothetical protein
MRPSAASSSALDQLCGSVTPVHAYARAALRRGRVIPILCAECPPPHTNTGSRSPRTPLFPPPPPHPPLSAPQSHSRSDPHLYTSSFPFPNTFSNLKYKKKNDLKPAPTAPSPLSAPTLPTLARVRRNALRARSGGEGAASDSKVKTGVAGSKEGRGG